MTAIIQNGVLKTDEDLPFPDQTRVKLIIETVEQENKQKAEAIQACEELQKSIIEHPIPGLASMFKSRDEIYERD